MRTKKEIYTDYLLTLYLVKCSQEENYRIEGPLKFQKLTFVSELEMMDKKEKGFHLKFFRYNLGPYSRELAEDYKELVKRDLVINYKLTPTAIDILNLFWSDIEKIKGNSDIIDVIKGTVDKYGKYTGPALTNKVYDMKIEPYDLPGQKFRIKEIPMFVDLIVPENFKASIEFDIPADLLDIFEEELKLSSEARERINKEWPSFLKKGKKKLLNAIGV